MGSSCGSGGVTCQPQVESWRDSKPGMKMCRALRVWASMERSDRKSEGCAGGGSSGDVRARRRQCAR